MHKLSNEKYLAKILGPEKMETLAKVVSLEFSLEALEKLKQIAREFVTKDQEELSNQTENFQERQKQVKTLKTEIAEKEDLRDKLLIVGLTRKPESNGRTWGNC